MLSRFAGNCEALGSVDAVDLVRWVGGIPFEEWPQQRRLDDGQIRPAMVSDPAWCGFGKLAAPVIAHLLTQFPGCEAYQLMLSVVMPGHSIEPHCDWQGPQWLCRVHVPLISNDRSRFIVAGIDHYLVPGHAYRVNTEVEHAVTNDGETPRIHFMFDVRRP